MTKTDVADFKDTQKHITPFNLEHEISKIKIPVPLLELMKTKSFKDSILKILHPSMSDISLDIVHLQDEKPIIMPGPHIEESFDSTPPFYISLNVHDKFFHNCLFDS